MAGGVGPGIWGNHVHADDPATSQSRWLDGLDTNNNGRDFGIQIATPGFTNNQSDLMPYSEDADTTLAGDPVDDWVFSYMPLRAVDPTVAGPLNPSAIAALPDGGNAMIAWDEAGGGNACYMSQLAKEDFLIDPVQRLLVAHQGGERLFLILRFVEEGPHGLLGIRPVVRKVHKRARKA